MGRLILCLHVAQKLPQHVAEAEHGIELQPVRLAVDRRQRVISAENVAGAVDQEEMVALFQRLGGAWRLWRCFLCGWHDGEQYNGFAGIITGPMSAVDVSPLPI